jgi:DNA repair protein RadC
LSDLIAGPAGELAPAISRKLIDTSGSLVAILAAAKIDELPTSLISDQVRHRLQYFAETIGSVWRHQAFATPILASSQALAKYLQFEMAGLTRETFRVLFLDSGNRLIRDQTMWEGSVNRVQIHPREVVSLALETHSSALILVHNHPSGRTVPSAEDIRLTQQIIAACKLLDIHVHDHLIVGKQDILSMRSKHMVVFTT